MSRSRLPRRALLDAGAPLTRRLAEGRLFTSLAAVPSTLPPPPLPAPLPVPTQSSVASSFAALGDASHTLHPLLLSSLALLGYMQPSHVQGRAFLPISQRRDVVIAAETGCGKTLAYLLPLLSAVLHAQADVAASSDDATAPVVRGEPSPRVILLTINRELCAQLRSVIRALLHAPPSASVSSSAASPAPLAVPRCAVLTGTSVLSPTASVDVLITTPSGLEEQLSVYPRLLSSTSTVVLDEADQLLLFPLPPFLTAIRRHRRVAGAPSLVFVAATLTNISERSGEGMIRACFKDAEWIRSSLFHGRRRGVRVDFHRVSSEEDRQAELLELLSQQGKVGGVRRVLVFCNTVERVQSLHAWLRRRGKPVDAAPSASPSPFVRLRIAGLPPLHAAAFHRLVPADTRLSLIEAFNEARASSAASVHALLCTNLAARGVDFCGVDVVLSYDCPLSLVDFLHRAGRTGRRRVGVDYEEGQERGRVITLWEEQQDGLLISALRRGRVQEEQEETEEGSGEWSGFSRRRSLRRSAKKQKQREQAALPPSEDEQDHPRAVEAMSAA